MTFYRFSVTCAGAHMHDSNLVPVVQKLDNAIHWIVQLFLLILIH